MADENNQNGRTTEQASGFPFVTVGATLGVLFAFVFLMWLAAQRENPLAAPKKDAGEAQVVPTLDETNARNEAALNGVGAKMSRGEARGKLLATLKTPSDKLPFPTPEPYAPAAPKKDEKKDAKEKKQ